MWKAYLKPTPPREGDVIALRSCGLESSGRQQWQLTKDGHLKLQGSLLCARSASANPMMLEQCSHVGDTFHHSSSAQLVHQGTGACIDVKSGGSVVLMDCESAQPSQIWAVDGITGSVTSMSGNYQGDLGGQCLTAGPSTSSWTPDISTLSRRLSSDEPARVGDTVKLSACTPGSSTQVWKFSEDGKIGPPGSGLCIHIAAVKQYPATLAACSDADRFEHTADLAQLRHVATGSCLDLGGAGAVGSWECGATGQPNQRWTVDVTTAAIVSESNHYAGDYGGYCLTRVTGDISQAQNVQVPITINLV